MRPGRSKVSGAARDWPPELKWHRELPPSAKVCTVTVRRRAGRWFASFGVTLQVLMVADRALKPPVSVDLGVKNFAALSTGERIPGPRAHRAASRRMRTAQRRVSRRVGGSRRRQKAVLLLARLHERVRN